MNVNIVVMGDGVIHPTYATDGAGAFDIYANETVLLEPRTAKTISTGLKFEVPEGHVLLVFSRSGHGFKDGIRLGNCVGVIDSDYRGELKIRLISDSNNVTKAIARGQAIAQGIVFPIPKVEFTIVDELSSTVRGENGFGSTD